MTARKTYPFLTDLRTAGVALILLCHFTQQSGSPYLVMSSQFFNIGNSVFFLISGLSFGIQGKIHSALKWYGKRLKRLYIPYEIMIITLLIIHIGMGCPLSAKQWILQVLGIHGWGGVWGATQTWFITSLLLCYAATPALSLLMPHLCDKKAAALFVIVMTSLPAVLAYIPHLDASLLSPVCWYALAYYAGTRLTEIRRSIPRAAIAVAVMCIGFAVRLICRHYCDGTILYDSVVSTYTHVLGAGCILYCGITPNWVMDCVLVLCVSVVIAAAANKLSKKIMTVLPG